MESINSLNICIKKNQNIVRVKANKNTIELAHFLYKEGYISRYTYEIKNHSFKIDLSMWNNSIILKGVSLFTKNVYVSYADLVVMSISNFNVLVLDTKYGYITQQEALRYKIGGTIKICLII